MYMNSAQLNPQGLDIGDVIKAVLPVVLGALSAQPQMSPQMSIGGGLTFNPFSSGPSGALSPQSNIDIGDVIKAVLPVILGALSAGPQVSPQMSIGGGLTFKPFSSGPSSGLSPQGIDIGDVIKIVLPHVLGALSAAPQGIRPQSSGPSAGVSPQGIDITDIVSRIVVPVVLSTLSISPQTRH